MKCGLELRGTVVGEEETRSGVGKKVGEGLGEGFELVSFVMCGEGEAMEGYFDSMESGGGKGGRKSGRRRHGLCG